jgi:hypothetical protein
VRASLQLPAGWHWTRALGEESGDRQSVARFSADKASDAQPVSSTSNGEGTRTVLLSSLPQGIVNWHARRLHLSVSDVDWAIPVGQGMHAPLQGAISRKSSAYFRTMVERCQTRAASAVEPDDKTYWLGLAQIWDRLAEREEE